MNLKEYLIHNDLGVQEFAEDLNISRTYLSAVMNGKIVPGKKTALIIDRKTRGIVSISELLRNAKPRKKRENKKKKQDVFEQFELPLKAQDDTGTNPDLPRTQSVV